VLSDDIQNMPVGLSRILSPKHCDAIGLQVIFRLG